MKIPLPQLEQLMHMTARIEAKRGDGSISRGTGFFFNFCVQSDGRFVPAIVTNKHVIDGSDRGLINFTMAQEGELVLGGHFTAEFEKFGESWLRHPSDGIDLAVLPLNQFLDAFKDKARKPFWTPLHMDMIASPELLDDLGPIEDIIMVGYPIGLWDAANNAPIFRRGITATHPILNLDGNPQFLIDCACFPGSSGSPVLLANIGSYVDKNLDVHIGSTRIALLGILWGGPQYTARGEVISVPVPTSANQVTESRIPSNLGYCIKSSELRWFESEIARRVAFGG